MRESVAIDEVDAAARCTAGDAMRLVGFAVGDLRAELDLDGEEASVIPANDQIDLVLTPGGPQVRDGCARSLGVDANTERDERLEERAEERPVARDGRSVSNRSRPLKV